MALKTREPSNTYCVILRGEALVASKAGHRQALTFADEFIAQAETRAERLGSNLGVVSAVFYFLPFVVTVLVIVGVPLIQVIMG